MKRCRPAPPGRRNRHDISRKTGRQMVIDQPDAPARPHVLMHGEPHFEAEFHLARQHTEERRLARGDAKLAAADSETGTQCSELGEVAVGAEGEQLPPQCHGRDFKSAGGGGVPVEADDAVTRQILNAVRHTARGQIIAMGEEIGCAHARCAALALLAAFVDRTRKAV